MYIAFGILSLGGTEPEIDLGVINPPPIATYVLKNTIATLGLKENKKFCYCRGTGRRACQYKSCNYKTSDFKMIAINK